LKLVDSSGYQDLDQSVQKTIWLASPFPKVPKQIITNHDEVNYVLRITIAHKDYDPSINKLSEKRKKDIVSTRCLRY